MSQLSQFAEQYRAWREQGFRLGFLELVGGEAVATAKGQEIWEKEILPHHRAGFSKMHQKMNDHLKRAIKRVVKNRIPFVRHINAILKDNQWELFLRLDRPAETLRFGDAIRSADDPEVKAFVSDWVAEVNGYAEALLDGKAELAPMHKHHFTYHLPPMILAVPERWEHVPQPDGSTKWQKVADARMLTTEEITQAKQDDPEMAYLFDQAQEALPYYEFVGSEFSDQCFRRVRYSALAMYVFIRVPRHVTLPTE